MGKIWESCRRGDNRKWLKTDPKLNLLTITTGPPPYINEHERQFRWGGTTQDQGRIDRKLWGGTTALGADVGRIDRKTSLLLWLGATTSAI